MAYATIWELLSIHPCTLTPITYIYIYIYIYLSIILYCNEEQNIALLIF